MDRVVIHASNMMKRFALKMRAAAARRHAPRIVFALVAVGLIFGGAIVVSRQLAESSLQLVGYTDEGIREAPRPWWVESYDYAQGLFWARQISHKVAPPGLSDEERVTRLALWVFDHFIGDVPSIPLREDHFFNTVRRGYGYCDQLAHVLATLYWSAGYPTRLLMLRDKSGGSPHTVTEVRINNRWVVVDPRFKVLFRDPEGHLIGVKDFIVFPEVLETYRIQEATRVTLDGFERGTVFKTAPYASLGDLLVKATVWSGRTTRQSRSLRDSQRYTDAGDHNNAGDHGAMRHGLSGAIRQLDRARRAELFGEDRQAEIMYTRIVRESGVPENVRIIAMYWLARLAWRAESRASCLVYLSSLPRSAVVMEEPWRGATATLWDRCTAMPGGVWVEHASNLSHEGG